MRLETTYFNERVELFDAVYGADRAAELRAVARLYNRHLGPIEALNAHRPEASDLALYSSSCRHSSVAGLMRDLETRPPAGQSPLVPGGGKGATLSQAVAGALGESAERLLAILHYQGIHPQLRFASYQELQREGVDAVYPGDLPLFAQEQYSTPGFRWQPFTVDTPVRWIRGVRLLTDRPVMVPAQLVLLWYERAPGEIPIGYPTTGGLVFHSDRRRAILHGLYELVERDAINVGWMCRVSPRRIEVDLEALLRDISGVERRMSTAFLSGVKVFLNTLDSPIPVMTVMAFDESRETLSFLAGGGAWSRKERALTQALFEAGQCRSVLRTLEHEERQRIQPWTPRSQMGDFLDATVYYGYRQNRPLLDWYMAGDVVAWDDVPSLSFASLDEEFVAVLEWLKRDLLDPVIVDLDSSCWPGAVVLKVIVPELTTAWVPAEPFLGHPRYYDLPQELGLLDRALTNEDFNKLPLPFP